MTILAHPRDQHAACPGCGTVSHRLHSRRSRTLRDLPWQGRPVTLRLRWSLRGGGAGLARRDADLGIFEGSMSDRTTGGSGLVVRSLGHFALGIYGASTEPQDLITAHDPLARFAGCAWIMPDEVAVAGGVGEVVRTGHRWLEARIVPGAARVRCAGASALLAAVRSGAGLAVLPRCIGDAEPSLTRLADGLEGEEPVELWLGVHRDLRRSRCVRAVMDLLISLFRDERQALKGGDC